MKINAISFRENSITTSEKQNYNKQADSSIIMVEKAQKSKQNLSKYIELNTTIKRMLKNPKLRKIIFSK